MLQTNTSLFPTAKTRTSPTFTATRKTVRRGTKLCCSHSSSDSRRKRQAAHGAAHGWGCHPASRPPGVAHSCFPCTDPAGALPPPLLLEKNTCQHVSVINAILIKSYAELEVVGLFLLTSIRVTVNNVLRTPSPVLHFKSAKDKLVNDLFKDLTLEPNCSGDVPSSYFCFVL